MGQVAARIKEFWAGQGRGGPLVSLWMREPVANLVQWDLAEQVAYWKGRTELREDTVPHIAISNEAETMAALLGVPVEQSATSVWAKPVLNSLREGVAWQGGDERLRTELQRRLALAATVPGHAVKMVPLSGVSDIMAAMRGAQDLMMDVLEEPEVAARVAAHVGELSRKVVSDLMSRIPLYDGGTLGGLAWLPGRGATISADMMMMCSPEWFRDYIWPEDQRTIESLDSVIIHLHSGGTGPGIASIVAPHPKVRAVEVSHDPSGPRLEDLAAVFKEVQRHTNLLVTCWSRKFTDDELRWMARHLDRDHLYLYQYVDSISEGQGFLERMARFMGPLAL